MRVLLFSAGLLAVAACVPADEALPLGSVQFAFTASDPTVDGVNTLDRYALRFDRVVLGFKTMTVGKIGAPDTCSYRGRGGVTDVVVDPRYGLVQTFNGILPVECPDVGAIFGPPENGTVPAEGTSPDDLVALAEGGLHALIDVTAQPPSRFGVVQTPYRIELRFDPVTTSTRFGGCLDANRIGGPKKGVQIVAGERDSLSVRFAAEGLFRQAIGSGGDLRAAAFAQADAQGDSDHVVTMTELDALPLTSIFGEGFYQLPSDARPVGSSPSAGSLGDFVRFLFRFTLLFRSDSGLCVGNPPGSR